MNEQPEALRLADAMQHYFDERGPDAEAVAAELRRLHEANEAFASRQTWWNNRTFELENALRKAVKALEMVVVDAKTTPNAYEAARRAIAAAKQALGEA